MQPNPKEDTCRACFPDPKTRLADPSALDCVPPLDAKVVDVKDSSEGKPSAAVFRKSRRLLLFIRLLFLVLHRFVKTKFSNSKSVVGVWITVLATTFTEIVSINAY